MYTVHIHACIFMYDVLFVRTVYDSQGGEKFMCDSCYPAPAPMGVQTLGSHSNLSDTGSATKIDAKRRSKRHLEVFVYV